MPQAGGACRARVDFAATPCQNRRGASIPRRRWRGWARAGVGSPSPRPGGPASSRFLRP